MAGFGNTFRVVYCRRICKCRACNDHEIIRYDVCVNVRCQPHFRQGQRIVARLRQRLYAATLRQEVEFVEKGEGDVLSRLSVDTTIVGERQVFSTSLTTRQ